MMKMIYNITITFEADDIREATERASKVVEVLSVMDMPVKDFKLCQTIVGDDDENN